MTNVSIQLKGLFWQINKRVSVVTTEDGGDGKTHTGMNPDRCNKLILTSSLLGFNKTMPEKAGLENWLSQ